MRLSSNSTVSPRVSQPVRNGLRDIPGPRGLPVVGSFLEIRRDPLGMLERNMRRHGPTVRYRFGPFDLVHVQDPEDIRHVLVKNHASYEKSPSYDVLREILGNGLVTSEGRFWRRQRKLAQPAFHHQSLAAFAETMGTLAAELADGWVSSPGERDVHEEMMRLTLRIVGHTLMSTELGGDANTIAGSLRVVLDYANQFEAFLLLPRWFPTPQRIRARRAIAALDGIVFRLIEERRRSGEPGRDLLGMLMSATDESGTERMTDRQLRDEVMTLVLAGHETTANALSWTWLLLGRHPEVLARLRGEIDEVLEGRPPALADLERLPYTQAVIKESMRIYPPVWMIERRALADDVLGGYRIPAGTLVAVSPWTLHRDPQTFPDPERFDPQRFLGEEAAARHRYSYLPFGAGPRTCIGNSFATMEAVILLATLAGRAEVQPLSGAAVAPEPSVTLRPSPGVWARVGSRM